MYSMDNLLTLVSVEQAQELRVRAGTPPVIVLEDRPHPLEGPPLTAESAEELLRSIANTRQMRMLRDRGAVEFIYNFRSASPFLVRASIENENVGFVIQ